MVSIKYYFGPDIFLYIPLYDKVESPWYILKYGTSVSTHFEIGYVFFCSVLKYIGISFWGISFIITSIYFYVIYKLFNYLSDYKIFALFLLVLLDYNLLFYEFRQCLAVAFFILSFLSFKNKKYFKYLLYTIGAILVHKSAIIMCSLMFISLNIKYIKINNKIYFIISILLVFFAFIGMDTFLKIILDLLPLNSNVLHSIIHHLSETKNFQLILIIYFLTICCIIYYNNFNTEDPQWQKWHWIALVFFILVVLLYQYWFLFNRIRSYFLPFILVYCINIINGSRVRPVLYKQILVFCLYLYSINYIHSYYKGQESFKSGVGKSSTIFDLRKKSEEQIKKENLEKAKKYWKDEYIVN
jgi:hypothetical protein